MNPRLHLLGLLARHVPHDSHEGAMLERMIRFVDSTPAALDWQHPDGHITGSAWVLDPSRSRVLLTFHRKLERWLQLGGHVEGSETVAEAALREAQEESGIAGISLHTLAVFDVDIHEIPATPKRAAHLHYDVRFLCAAPGDTPRATAESKEVRWVPLADVASFNPDASMLRMLAKTYKTE
jgi:8-oxo-dGTP pyrophosphatase MutT (NUDIX family)